MLKILLAEDEPVLARNIVKSLETLATSIDAVTNAGDLREKLRTGHYDLLVIDISLGDGDGVDSLRQFPRTLQDTPVVIISATDSVFNRNRVGELEDAIFLAKPFALSQLNHIVGALTSAKNAIEEGGHAPTMVMYSHDTIGLGHMRRNDTIAREMLKRIRNLSVVMLVGSNAQSVSTHSPGIDYVKLPSLTKLGRDQFQSTTLRIDAQRTRDVRANIIRSVVTSLQPDLFLVDHEPRGAMNELLPVLEYLRENKHTKTVLGLRDILDEPERTMQKWKKNNTEGLIRDHFDRLLVYGDPDFFPSSTLYGLEKIKPNAVTHCGVVTHVRRQHRDRLSRHSISKVLVSGGGGRDAYPLVEASIKGVMSIPGEQRPKLTIVTGPLMDREFVIKAKELGLNIGATIIEHTNDLPKYMRECDLFIAMTGYNSINEAIALGCRILTVPRTGPSAEQRLRAQALKLHNLAQAVSREEFTPAIVRDAIMHPARINPAITIDIDGASRAADALIGLFTKTYPARKKIVNE